MRIERESEDLMRALLEQSRAAGHVDPARFAKARDVVHEAWLEATTPRARSWWWRGAAAAAVATIVVWGLWRRPAREILSISPVSAPAIAVTTTFVSGSIRVRDGDGKAERLLRPGESLAPGVTIVTGPAGRGTVTLPDGADVRLDRNTAFRVDGNRRFTIESGGLYFDTTPRRRPGAPVQMLARGAVVTDLGTRYELRLFDDRVRLRVRDGLVQVRRGTSFGEASEASELTMTSARMAVTRTEIFGPDWNWIVQASGAPHVEGRSLGEFLAWVVREGGRSVQFLDPAIERSVDTTIVYGTVEGLTVDEALDVVLPSCGLTHRIDGGTIVISADTGTKGAR